MGLLLILWGHGLYVFQRGQGVDLCLYRLYLFANFLALALCQICIFTAAYRALLIDCALSAGYCTDTFGFLLRRFALAGGQVRAFRSAYGAIGVDLILHARHLADTFCFLLYWLTFAGV